MLNPSRNRVLTDPRPLRTSDGRPIYWRGRLVTIGKVRTAAVGAVAVVALAVSGVSYYNAQHPDPPACAHYQDMGMNQQEQCLEDVSNWCLKYGHVDEVDVASCELKVYGYDPSTGQ